MDFPIIPVVDIDIPFVNPQAKALDIERFSASTLIFLFGLQEPLTSYVLPVNGLYSAKMRTATTSRTHGPSPGSHRGVESRVKFDKTILSGTSTRICGYTREFLWQDTHFFWKFMSNSRPNEHGATESSSPEKKYNLAWMAIVKLAIVDMYRD
ncbi:hypothetical protein PCH_Pc24g02720 [Penicillium rubens Wisconsin 54-1255]|uniref:Uncharacterized protein n=1 Tax=Penicillium rubens (strain ATCC 28089 / DSM 1075 / NRRL 1951 / Wisconsin 54-1255) TaxID=500485 RepID=B6HX44_PENRW|nr:hypothetical protein PCH_Pc24g02720 [Penicillium rubens Wisconsin 54-1255]